MRNRVPGRRARSLITKVAVLVGLVMLTSTQVAAAASGAVESRIPFDFAGPVGITTVALGVGGLLLGLWRFRRKAIKVAAEARAKALTATTPQVTVSSVAKTA